MPDMVGILFNRPVRREVAHIGDVEHRFVGPLFRVTVELVHLILTIDVATIIRQHLIVVAKVNQRIQQVAIAAGLRRTEQAGTDLRQRLMQLRILLVVVARFVAAAAQRLNLLRVLPKMKIFSSPTCSSISTLAPSRVPMVSAPLSANFMLLVPEASVPASEICSERSAAGIISWARLTL
ncbi:Uncharacterised protein [Raoultella terrigena]|uniref:Uncharacterized protein n=1 Tax=Raoultella terrigena TaxID=577 RepID=A0A7Z8Z5G9_RAOTE|nr:Uncharacterised protein [Raoultella terrigena]